MTENTKKPMIKGNSSKIISTTLILIMLQIINLDLFKEKVNSKFP